MSVSTCQFGHPRRTSPIVLDKLLGGQIRCFVLDKGDLPEEVSTVWIGSKVNNVVVGSVTLGPSTSFTKAPQRFFSLCPLRNGSDGEKDKFVRNITASCAFARSLGNGKSYPASIAKGSSYIESVLPEDLQRNLPEHQTLRNGVLPQIDLVQVAHHFCDSLTPMLLDRLRILAGALNGATVRIGSTCSGLETMPSIMRAIFRWENPTPPKRHGSGLRHQLYVNYTGVNSTNQHT